MLKEEIQIDSAPAAKNATSAARRRRSPGASNASRHAAQAQISVLTCQRYGWPAWKKFQATSRLSTTGTSSAAAATAGLSRSIASGSAAAQKNSAASTCIASGVARCMARPIRKGHIPYRSCSG